MRSEPDLILQAIRLYPGNVYLQREWMRAVEVVRGSKRGWLLDWMPTDVTRRAIGRVLKSDLKEFAS